MNCYVVVCGTDFSKWLEYFCYRAVGFLTQFPSHMEILGKLGPELQELCSALQSNSLPAVRERVHDTMSCYWMALLKTHPLDRQRDARFQSLLSISLEKWVYFIWNLSSLSMSLCIFLCKLYKINACWWHHACQTTHLFHLWNCCGSRLNLVLGVHNESSQSEFVHVYWSVITPSLHEDQFKFYQISKIVADKDVNFVVGKGMIGFLYDCVCLITDIQCFFLKAVILFYFYDLIWTTLFSKITVLLLNLTKY